MSRLKQKIENAQKFENDKEGVILNEIERVNDTLDGGELAKEKTVETIEEGIAEIFKGISLIKGEQGIQGEKGGKPSKNELIEIIKPLIPEPIKGDFGYTPIKGIDYLTDTEIELIKTEVTPVIGEDYFTKEEINKIKKELTPKKGKDYLTKKEIEKIKKEITPVKGKDYFDGVSVQIPFGGAGSHGREDFTSQCNGVLKIFTLTQSYRAGTVTLLSTQFPIIYRPGVDFTESGDKQITLTSEVGAPETGQTLICNFEKQ